MGLFSRGSTAKSGRSAAGAEAEWSGERIGVVAQIRAKSGHEAEVRALFTAVVGPSQKEAGCLKYHLYEDKYYTGSFYTVEEWESEAALERHLQGAKEVLNQAKALLREELRISVVKLLA